MAECSLRQLEILGFSMLTGRPEEVATWLAEAAQGPRDRCTIVSHINANNYYWIQKHPEWRERLRSECVLVMDGIGVQLGAFLLGRGWLPNLNGTDLFPLVMQEAARARLRVFLLGGSQDVVGRSAEVIRRRFPGIAIAGARSGYFEPTEENKIASRIRDCGAEMLLVGRGFLRQELFALQHRERLTVPLIWNVGGLFDFVSGQKPRAPVLVRRARLEWAFRFLLDPRAMWHRNLVAAPWFLGHVVRQSCRSRPTFSLRQHVRHPGVGAWVSPLDREPRPAEGLYRSRTPRQGLLVGEEITGRSPDA